MIRDEGSARWSGEINVGLHGEKGGGNREREKMNREREKMNGERRKGV